MSEEVDAVVENPVKRMRLRYAGTCVRCGAALEAKAWAFYDRSTKTVHCVECPGDAGLPEAPMAEPGARDSTTLGPATPAPAPAPVPASAPASPSASASAAASDAAPAPAPGPTPSPDEEPAEPVLQVIEGLPGGSAQREYERRSAARQERVRAEHPRIGGLLLALFDDPQSTKAWASGAVGEQWLGEKLAKVAGPTLRVLHDRRIPKAKANIDHIVVCPTGVVVVDAKHYKGKRPALRVEGGFLRPRVETLLVGGRDRSKLVDGVLKQVDLVRAALGETDVPVRGVLCFVDADWPLIGGTFSTRGVDVLWPRKLAAKLGEEGPLHEAAIEVLHRRLAQAFPAA